MNIWNESIRRCFSLCVSDSRKCEGIVLPRIRWHSVGHWNRPFLLEPVSLPAHVRAKKLPLGSEGKLISFFDLSYSFRFLWLHTYRQKRCRWSSLKEKAKLFQSWIFSYSSPFLLLHTPMQCALKEFMWERWSHGIFIFCYSIWQFILWMAIWCQEQTPFSLWHFLWYPLQKFLCISHCKIPTTISLHFPEGLPRFTTLNFHQKFTNTEIEHMIHCDTVMRGQVFFIKWFSVFCQNWT